MDGKDGADLKRTLGDALGLLEKLWNGTDLRKKYSIIMKYWCLKLEFRVLLNMFIANSGM